ncbi:hypothetical protein M3172_14570 [Mesobacillus subterraneus]|uniref:hypothetical protein n=1 Tax=Mesobacillus subterraneus TaxID=285983 RepID=UPI00203E3B7B|nr:hypothetical protein [Mesobacillus subterraneus]MCM3574417.1 hypothetical protein [Mesobacillus subterraneus]
MRKLVISAFVTSSVILAVIFGLHEDRNVEMPNKTLIIPGDKIEMEDSLIDNFQFVNLEELKSSSTGLIRMNDINEENLTVTGSINTIEENADNLDSDLQWADYIEDILLD